MYATSSHWDDRRWFSKAHCSLIFDRPSALDRMIGDVSCMPAASRWGGSEPSLRMTCEATLQLARSHDQGMFSYRANGKEERECRGASKHVL